jgi:hypothetical protein
MAVNRWEVTDAEGQTHVVSVHKGLFGTPTLRVNGEQVMNLAGDGIVAFEVGGRQARLSPQPGSGVYDFSVGSVTTARGTIGAGDMTSDAMTAPAPGPDAAFANLVKQRDNGASWFFWIGGLTLLNTVLFVIGSDYGFASGLGLSLFIAVLLDVVSEGSLLWLAVLLDLPLIAMLFFFGRRARRGAIWPFVAGGLFYLLDLGLILLVQDWISVAIHALALFAFFSGWRAARALSRMERSPA